MTIEKEQKIIKGLREHGITAKLTCNRRNGVLKMGFILRTADSLVAPVLYFNEKEEVEDYVQRAIDFIDHHEEPKFDISMLAEKSFALDHVIMSLQKRSDENLVKRTLFDNEVILRIEFTFENDTDSIPSIKVTDELLDYYGLTEGQMFDAARKNMRDRFIINSLPEMVGLNKEFFDVEMYVCSTENAHYGAAALAFPELFASLCEMGRGYKKLVLLPSSIHELVILPLNSDTDLSELKAMVHDINVKLVEPELQLDEHLYIYDHELSILSSL